MKTFGELTINDQFFAYFKDQKSTNIFKVTTLRESEYRTHHIEVGYGDDDDWDETIDLPTDQHRHETDIYIYTTDKNEYNMWRIPGWKEEIEKNKKQIAMLNSEIEELNRNINNAEQSY